MVDKSEILLVTSLARKLLEGQINYDQFLQEYPEDSTNKNVEELFSLIEHQPKLGGLFGVNKNKLQDYLVKIQNLIELLEKSVDQ